MSNADPSPRPSSARALGYSYGVHLGDYDEGLRLAELPLRDRVLREEQAIQARVAIAGGGAEGAESRLERARERWALARSRLARLTDARDGAPMEFSPRKGALYLFISLALVIGDMAIVGMVMADAFGFKWNLDENTTVISLLFSHPVQAIKGNPELLFLASGVILIGMFIKVLRDTYISAVSGPEGPVRGIRRAEYRAAIALTLMSVLTLVAVSLLRGDFGVVATDGAVDPAATDPGGIGLRGWASAVIGFTLPFIAAGFFIKGYDCLSNWLAFRSAWLDERWTEWMVGVRRTRTASRQGAFEDLRTRRADCASPEHLNARLSECRADYDAGYRSGVQDLLGGADGRSIYDSLQPIALQRVLANQRS